MHRSPWVLELSPIDCHVLSWPFKKHRLRPTTWKASKHWCNGNTAYQLICCASLLMLCSYKVYNRIVLDTHWTRRTSDHGPTLWFKALWKMHAAGAWLLGILMVKPWWSSHDHSSSSSDSAISSVSDVICLSLAQFFPSWSHGGMDSALFEIRVCLGPTEWTATDINIHQLLMYSILARATSTQPLRIS